MTQRNRLRDLVGRVTPCAPQPARATNPAYRRPFIEKAVLVVLVAAVIGIGFLAGCSSGHDRSTGAASEEKTLYTCGMHPNVIQDKPGNCPICGMKLTPIRKSGGDSNSAASSMSTISVDPVTRQNMNVRTTQIERGALRRTIRTVGIVEHSEAAVADVTTKFNGWVEKLYVDATGQHVHRGDPLFEIYSPELYSAQTEYLLALDSATSGSAVLKETARRKLKYMDISDEQVSELEKTREPRKTLRIGAPIDGYVMNKMAVEGQMVEPGMTLYRLANHDTIWVQGEIYEQDVPLVRLGQEASVTVNAWPDLKFRGRVTFILPEFDEKTRTVKVRMEFHNPGHILRPGMFATARIVADVGQSAVLVPDSAVLRSGEKNTVFVALDEGRFEPRTVVLGRAGEDNHYEVVSGLSAGERVVASGQFMLDSESQLREAIQKMMGTAEGPSVETSARASGSASSAVNIPDAQHSTIYICPMPEHVAIEHMQPGKCSLCGMGLVPVSPEMLERIQPGGKIDGYTCPMPEHSDVREAKPGKCARCGMTLVPIMSLPELPDEAPQLYTCPMASHAHVVSDKPGKCPECEMDLVPTNGVRHGKTAEENWRKQHPAQP